MRRASIPITLSRLARVAAASACMLVPPALAGCGSTGAPRRSALPTVTGSHATRTLRYLQPAFSHITTMSNVAYGEAKGPAGRPDSLTLDLYEPSGDSVTRRPAIVWVHGGGFSSGDDTSGPSAELAQKFAYLGYVTVSIDYRLLSPSFCVVRGQALTPTCRDAATAAGHDAQAAVRWLRAHATRYRIDPDRIGVGGDSAGAVAATLVGLDAQGAGDSGTPGQPSGVRAFMSLSGGVPGDLLAGAELGSRTASGLLFSGTADPTVPYAWSQQTTSALTGHGVPAILVSFAGAGHDPYQQYEKQIDTQSDYFFYTFMDVAHAQGSPADAASRFAAQMASIARSSPGYAKAVALLRARG